MEIADAFLIAWWLLVATTVLPFLSWKQHAADRKTAILARQRGQSTDAFQDPVLASLFPKPAHWTLAVLWGALALSIIPLTWMSHWSWLLHLNFQFLIAGFGALMIWAGPLRKNIFAQVSWILLGMALIGYAGYIIAADLLLPPRVLEGRVGNKFENWYKGSWYKITVDGTTYQAIRPVYLPLRVGDRIRAEAGAGSKVIFSARKL